MVHGFEGAGRLDGRESVAPVGERLHVPPRTAHDWWNAGDEKVRVVEVSPARLEEAVSNTFGLARDGRTNAEGMPNLLQISLLARELEDVLLYFASPPRPVQKALFAVLAPVARLLGHRGSYPGYTANRRQRVEAEPWPGLDAWG